jgi:hypothetical protein
MKIYEGGRGLAGAEVTVDGAPLDPRFDLRSFSPMGFEWTYEGEAFMRQVVAELDNAWVLTGEDIDAALREIGG